MPAYLLLQGGGKLLLQSGPGALLLQWMDPGVAEGAWVCPACGRAWTAPRGCCQWIVPDCGRVWRADPMATFAGYIEKTPTDLVWLVHDFGNLPEIRAGQTITGFSIPAVAGITISGAALEANGYRVGAWYGGGTDQVDYDVTCTINLSGGGTDARTGTLQVRSKST